MPMRSRGFTLIEVLVGLVVLSIGLLGIAALQLSGLKYTQGAYQRTQASLIVVDLLDRIRANADGIAAGSFDNLNSASPPADPGCADAAGGCTPTELAAADFADWVTNSLSRLSGGTATVSRDAVSGIVTVTVNWQETVGQVVDGSKTGANEQMTMTVRARL